MSKFLIVLSDNPSNGGPSGDHLAYFLGLYAPGEVKVTTPNEILNESSITTEIVFVALPTSFCAHHENRIRRQKLVLFDYYDDLQPEWSESDEEFLSTLTDCYLKTHTNDEIDIGFKAGTLPVTLNQDIGREYDRYSGRRIGRHLGALMGRNSRPIDLSFFGAVTFFTKSPVGEPSYRYHQRIEWIREIVERSDWRFRGGLLELTYCRFADLEGEGTPVPEARRIKERLGFRELFAEMSRSRISLTPTGHARWTYRHYESVYAGCDVISTDLTGIRTLIPLPTHCFEEVPDHQPIAPSVEKLLEHWRDRAPLREAALEHFEQYLFHGRYDVRRPAIFDQFLGQVEES